MTKHGFWVVWCARAGQPTVTHDSWESAKQEAERLASANPGKEFHILQVVGTVQVPTFQWTSYDFDDGPL